MLPGLHFRPMSHDSPDSLSDSVNVSPTKVASLTSASCRGIAQLADRAPGWLERSLQTFERERSVLTTRVRDDIAKSPDLTGESIASEPVFAAGDQVSRMRSVHRLLHSRWLAMGRRDPRAGSKPLSLDELFRLVRQELCVPPSVCSDGDVWNLFKLLSYGKIDVTKPSSRGRRSRRLSSSSFVQVQRSILAAARTTFCCEGVTVDAARCLVDALSSEADTQRCMPASTLSRALNRIIPCSALTSQLLCVALQRSHDAPVLICLDDVLRFLLLSPAEIESLGKSGRDGDRRDSLSQTATDRTRVDSCDDGTTMALLNVTIGTELAVHEDAENVAGPLRSFGDRKPLAQRPPLPKPYVVPSMWHKVATKACRRQQARVDMSLRDGSTHTPLGPASPLPSDRGVPNTISLHGTPVGVDRFWHFVRLTPTELLQCATERGGLDVMHVVEPQGTDGNSTKGAAKLKLETVARGLLPLPLTAREHHGAKNDSSSASAVTERGQSRQRRQSKPPCVAVQRSPHFRFEPASTWSSTSRKAVGRAGSASISGSASNTQPAYDSAFEKTLLQDPSDAGISESQINLLIRSRIEGAPVIGSLSQKGRQCEEQRHFPVDHASWRRLMLARLT